MMNNCIFGLLRYFVCWLHFFSVYDIMILLFLEVRNGRED